MKPNHFCYHRLLLIISSMAIFFFCHNKANATDSLVTGKYISAVGTEIVLNLTIQNPAPANLIVEQYLGPENKIVATSPQAKKVDNSQGNIKWLFKNTRNGILSLSLRLSKPLSGDISAIVRYRSPQGGAFTELKITP
jgi:hypothetical protein